MNEPWAPEYRLQLVEVESILSDNTGLDVKDVGVLDEGVLEDLYAGPDYFEAPWIHRANTTQYCSPGRLFHLQMTRE